MRSLAFSPAVILLVLSSCQNGARYPAENKTSPGNDTFTEANDLQVPARQPGVSTDYLIIPGKSMGKTFLGEDAETLYNTLGKPDFSDAAMGKAWMIWFGRQRDAHNNRTELDVYVTYKDSTMSSKVIKQVRTTSSSFKVNDSVHVYAGLATIKHRFPGIAFAEKYRKDSREISVYDDAGEGIAFDIVDAGRQQICIGISVHEPGTSVNAVYLRLAPPDGENQAANGSPSPGRQE